ncbi:Fe-S cluster assembly protein SufD [Aliidiomarina celeris]|uniref:Fe-S cluster assembly protein SufD n=1 Tax=Aliidiomarina celeris TaxID=2249428 RepID=UPI000DE9A863|nr:Fe-S cluster assembly protein SufD [Aliidiomarina celeris]
MSEWLASVVDRAERVDDWLSPARQQALQRLLEQRWPTRRTEAWRYTSLHTLEKLQLPLASAAENSTSEIPVIDGLQSLDFVFENGQFVGVAEAGHKPQPLEQARLPNGLSVHALLDSANTELSAFNKAKPSHHLFGLVNDVLAQQGLVIHIKAGATVAQPIRVVNRLSADVESHHRVLVVVGEGAKATVIEHGFGSCASVSTAFAEFTLAANSQLEHYRFALHGGEAQFFGGSHFNLGEHARLNSTVVGYGSQISRLDIDLNHVGEHAYAKMNAVYLLAPKEHFDLHTSIEHMVPNGTTEENARGIVGDKARAVFNGRIHIHRDAQKTLAELNNRNLLLSRGGHIATKPELEIYADDVQCAHGATVAEIAEKELYYLQTRGIPRSQALVMLNFGFIQELVNQMPNKAISEWLAPQLRERFTAMEQK